MGGQTADYKFQLEKIASGHLAEAVKEAKAIDPSVAVEPIVAPLRPVESLLEASLERQARVTVVGGGGERPTVGAILGSVPDKLLHRSTVPVLVVPTAEE